jgi:hypothetical protein
VTTGQRHFHGALKSQQAVSGIVSQFIRPHFLRLPSHKGCLSSQKSSKANPVPRIFRQNVEFARSGNPETTRHSLQVAEPA